MEHDRLHAIWETEIDRLELEVIRIERLVRGLVSAPVEPWHPPVVPGPIPEELVERITSLLERQEIAKEALILALAEAQRQATYADRVIEINGRRTSEPIYFDLEA